MKEKENKRERKNNEAPSIVAHWPFFLALFSLLLNRYSAQHRPFFAIIFVLWPVVAIPITKNTKAAAAAAKYHPTRQSNTITMPYIFSAPIPGLGFRPPPLYRPEKHNPPTNLHTPKTQTTKVTNCYYFIEHYILSAEKEVNSSLERRGPSLR